MPSLERVNKVHTLDGVSRDIGNPPGPKVTLMLP